MNHNQNMITEDTCNHLWYGFVAGIFFVIDRILKYIAPDTPSLGEQSFFGWDYFENTGIAFSIPLPLPMSILLTPIILIVLLHILSRHTHPPHAWLGFWCITAGALSNLIDRLSFGYVIDYIRIGTSVLNIADLLILTGVIILLFTRRVSTHRIMQ